ncbi:RimK family protein [Teredinibacter turnerae]|uniref:RimK family protein n=1 Tax=Teredinibacter turnerae TaxID=2426 RepID=UPI00035E1E5C|nr:RimK family protein [Teredinibacter turnerae]
MITSLFVVEDTASLALVPENAVTFDTYLKDYPKLNEPRLRVINLCDTSRYLSQGYYCSLLAEARQHDVLPSVKVINNLRASGVGGLWFNDKVLGKDVSADEITGAHLVCMGEVADVRLKKLAQRAFEEFSAPLLRMVLSREASGLKAHVTRVSLASLSEAEQSFAQEVLASYARQSWRKRGASKKYRWEMAMLVDENEAVPPSDKGALSRFISAGKKLGIRIQQVTAAEIGSLNQYDGLFIRETTAIDHHTYRLAREAEESGLVVMDDPESILRCCNKVYLHDAFNYKKVPSLRTEFVSDANRETLEGLQARFGFPLVLKMPEGSFSRGVFKVSSPEELEQVCRKLLAESALVLAQEFLFTEFDWRIGVLNGRALYACRYYMARNHWQIYNHGNKRHFSGGFDALATFEVPRKVLTAALKAAAVVGQGLYGIDIKEVDGKAYVLEVNDNPSLDHGVEDKYLGDELYMQIMSEFSRRLELRGR